MKPNVETWALENRIDPSTLVDGKLDEFLSELGYKYAIGLNFTFPYFLICVYARSFVVPFEVTCVNVPLRCIDRSSLR